MLAASTAADILDAARGYLWLALAAVVVWRLFPVIRKRVETEDFAVEIAGQKVSFQRVSNQVQRELDDLRSQVIALAERLEGTKTDEVEEVPVAPVEVPARRARILWVDDQPENNAFLIKSLEDRDADVVEAASTEEALAELASNPRGFDLVISDMGRTEGGSYRALAGVELLRRMREENLDVPVVIYASQRAIARGGQEALEAGALAVTASPTELVTTIRIGPTTAFEAAVAEIVREHLNARPFPIYKTVDFVVERNDERVGIEIKNWSHNPTREEFDRAFRRVADARERYGFDRILMIVRPGIELPAGVSPPPWLTVLTPEELTSPTI